MDKKTLFIVLLAFIFVPIAFVSGQTLASMAQAIAGQVVIVATWIVVIMWVVTGILYLTCLGDPGKLKLANTSLFAAIGGTILVILAQGAIAFVKNSFNI